MLLMPGVATAQAGDNRETVRRLYEEALNKRNFALLSQFISEDYTGPNGLKGPAGFEAPVAELIKALPDAQWNIEELISEGDKVVVKWTIQGTQTGQFRNIRPTGKTVSNTGIGIYAFKNGRITATEVHTDRLGFLQQLGVLPQPGNPPVNKVSFIDKFIVPAGARKEFIERMRINRSFIRSLPGFMEDAAYEQADGQGNTVIVTVAHWTSAEAVDSAKNAVQAFYREQGFDMPAMLKRLNITLDRGLYKDLKD